MLEQKSVAWPRAFLLPFNMRLVFELEAPHVEVQLQPKDPRQRHCNPDSFQSTLCQSLLRQMLDWGSLPSAQMDHVIRCIPAPRIRLEQGSLDCTADLEKRPNPCIMTNR